MDRRGTCLEQALVVVSGLIVSAEGESAVLVEGFGEVGVVLVQKGQLSADCEVRRAVSLAPEVVHAHEQS